MENNIFNIRLPFNLLREGVDLSQAKQVVFWGADVKYLPPGIPEDKFINLSNLCLDFVRNNCRGYELIYKLHPAETDEYTKLKLDGFKIVGTDNIGEFYLLKNIDKIKYTFSAISGACVSAHKMGIPSYIFLELFEPLFRDATKKGYREYFSPLPEESLISDLNGGFKTYVIKPALDEVLYSNMNKIFKNNSGKVFFIADTPGVLAEIIALSSLIKKISSKIKVGLVICWHHRWNVMNMDDLKIYFDSINIFPRTFYSLRPRKILKSFKISRAIKRFPIKPGDTLIGMTHTSWPEVCFISYHKQAKRLAFLSQVSFDTVYGNKSKDMLANIKYRKPSASRFYNLFLEPMLGLYRTIYMDDPGKVMNFRSYQKPIGSVYDQVYLF